MAKPKIILDRFQEEAITSCLEGNSVIVCAPTGAGKTLIAEHIIENCLSKNKGVIYTAPIKALSNQKFRDFSNKYPQFTGIVTGDVRINPHAPILIMTTEIFRNGLLNETDNFQDKEWVIFDEIHYLDDIERGTVWEETIMLLPKHMRMLALSATFPNTEEFLSWLNKIHSFPVKAIIETQRPVPLHFRFQCQNEFFNSFKDLKKANVLKSKQKKYSANESLKPNSLFKLIRHLENDNLLPAIYFSFSRRRCESLAEEISNFNFLEKPSQRKIVQIFRQLTKKLNIEDAPQAEDMLPLIKKGIAFHHAGLLPPLKDVIEQLFCSGLIKLIFTTETFALGINMPARTVVFDTLYKFYGRFSRYLRTRDFYQMAGRAGRRNIDKEGFVYIRINPNKIELKNLENIIYGQYEPIISQFSSGYATILNLYKDMGEKLYEIYPRSFHFHQSNPILQKQGLRLLKNKVGLLKELEYIINGELTWKAHIACQAYGFELQIGQLYQEGLLEKINEPTLFILLSSLIYEPRRGQRKPQLNRPLRRLEKWLKKFIRHIHQYERRWQIYPLSKRFAFHLANAAQAWYEGENFYRLLRLCDIDEGEIIRCFRMTIQLMREILSSQSIHPLLGKKLITCIKHTNRGVVNAENQLKEDIHIDLPIE